MLSTMRTVFAQSWVARILAIVLALSFGAWGIQGALFGGGIGGDNVARVDGTPVTAQAFDRAYQGALREAAETLSRQQSEAVDPAAIPPPMRRGIAQETLQQMVTAAAVDARARGLGLTVPDAVLRQTIFGIPQFKGVDGKFDRARFDAVLSQNGLTEARVLSLFRDQLLSEGMLSPLRSPVTVPPPMLDALYAYGAEQRRVRTVTVAFDAMPAPAPPDAATLQRFFANHPKAFEVPEMRKIRVVLLSKQTLARDVAVPEAEIRSAYDAERARLVKPERRSVEVATFAARAPAEALAAAWRGGLDWGAVQAAARKAGGATLSLDRAASVEIPSPKLAAAMFAAPVGTVSGPSQGEAGWNVFEVTAMTPASGDYAEAHDAIREQLAERRVASTLQDRVDRLQDAVAGGGLDRIPADLGAVAAEGTLDRAGDTADGEPAPLPGTDAIRRAIVEAAFSLRKGEPASLQPGPEGSYFAVEVEEVTPSHPRDFEAARADVLALWRSDAVRREANVRATAIYLRAEAQRALAPAAAGTGLAVADPPPFRRGGGEGVPAALATVAFGLSVGDAAMVETDRGFVVATLTAIEHPPIAADAQGAGRLADQLQRSLMDDVESDAADAIAHRARIRTDPEVVSRIIGP